MMHGTALLAGGAASASVACSSVSAFSSRGRDGGAEVSAAAAMLRDGEVQRGDASAVKSVRGGTALERAAAVSDWGGLNRRRRQCPRQTACSLEQWNQHWSAGGSVSGAGCSAHALPSLQNAIFRRKAALYTCGAASYAGMPLLLWRHLYLSYAPRQLRVPCDCSSREVGLVPRDALGSSEGTWQSASVSALAARAVSQRTHTDVRKFDAF